MPSFRLPFFNYYNYMPYYKKNNIKSNSYNNAFEKKKDFDGDSNKKNNSKSKDSNEPFFFELFGLKLYFDDILLICLIFFLYDEGVKDDELFISLILLLLS